MDYAVGSLTRSPDLPPTRQVSAEALANGRRVILRSGQSDEAERWWAGSSGLAPQNQRIWTTLYFFSVGWSLHPSCRISAGEKKQKKNARLFFISFSSEYLLTGQGNRTVGEDDDDHHLSRNKPQWQKQLQVKEAENVQWWNKRKCDVSQTLGS